MARIAGINLPKDKRIDIGLTAIHGIGINTAKKICAKLKINPAIRVKDLSSTDEVKLVDEMKTHMVEGDLRRKVMLDVKRLQEIGSYRGFRHKRGLPVRGQRTKTNARTKRGRRVTVAGKKKETK